MKKLTTPKGDLFFAIYKSGKSPGVGVMPFELYTACGFEDETVFAAYLRARYGHGIYRIEARQGRDRIRKVPTFEVEVPAPPKTKRMWTVRHRLDPDSYDEISTLRIDAQARCDLLNKRTEYYRPHHKESDYGFRVARIEIREISCRKTP